jgi:hypothetical protein
VKRSRSIPVRNLKGVQLVRGDSRRALRRAVLVFCPIIVGGLAITYWRAPAWGLSLAGVVVADLFGLALAAYFIYGATAAVSNWGIELTDDGVVVYTMSYSPWKSWAVTYPWFNLESAKGAGRSGVLIYGRFGVMGLSWTQARAVLTDPRLPERFEFKGDLKAKLLDAGQD